MVLGFSSQGYRVVFTHLGDEARAKALESPNIWSIEADVADFQKAHEIVEAVVKQWGRIDVLISNAGIALDKTVWKMTEEAWDRVIAVNLKGAFNYTHAVIPVMRQRKEGVLLYISSINGLRGKFGQANYCASKAGLIGFAKAVAREVGAFHIRVHVICPGLIETPLMEKLSEEIKRQALRETLLGKLGKPEDVANVALFLASSQAGHMTGEIIKVDGGQYL